eukprot:1964782-Rhodomonas_salina.4
MVHNMARPRARSSDELKRVDEISERKGSRQREKKDARSIGEREAWRRRDRYLSASEVLHEKCVESSMRDGCATKHINQDSKYAAEP